MSRFIKTHLLLLAVLLFVADIIYVWWSPTFISMTRDEYVFYRLTLNLPRYNTDAEWFTDDVAKELGYTDPMADLLAPDVVALNKASYDMPMWIHPPMANYLAYPILKLFNNPAKQIKAVHLVCVAFILITVSLFADIIRRRTSQFIAGLSVFPMLISQWLLLNGIMFYYDIFMWLLFALTMWVIERKPNSRWIIPLSVMMVLTKINAVLLLAPVALFLWYKNKRIEYRVIVPSISVVAMFLVIQAVVAKDAMYMVHHWGGGLSSVALSFVRTEMLPNIVRYAVSWGLFIYIPLLLAGFYLAVRHRMGSQYPFVALGLIALCFGFGWAWLGYQVYPIMYSSMFMIPIVVSLLDKGVIKYELD